MEENKIVHFEELWNKAEELAKTFDTYREDIYQEIKEKVDEYKKTDNLGSPIIEKNLKTKKLGEILFKLAELSKLDDVNSYEALQIELNYLTNR